MKMKYKLLVIVGVILLVILAGPFLVPVRPLPGLVSPAELADADSQFVEIAGVDVHYKTSGTDKPVYMMLHGFGSNTYSWHALMSSGGLAGSMIAYDRPAYGLTERPLTWVGENPYSTPAQLNILVGILDVLDHQSAILIGNSAGGTLAVYTALQAPARVDALILISPAIYTGGGAPALVRPLLQTPQMRHLGPLITRRFLQQGDAFLETAWHDPDRLTADIREAYKRPLQAENWDAALWEATLASGYPDLVSRLDELAMPVLIITGDDDRIVPTADSIRLAGDIPGAELVVIPQCGHVPQEECPEAVIAAIDLFTKQLP